jgi:hypothetical protein
MVRLTPKNARGRDTHQRPGKRRLDASVSTSYHHTSSNRLQAPNVRYISVKSWSPPINLVGRYGGKRRLRRDRFPEIDQA